MGIVSVLWVIFIVLKIVGVIGASWWLVILWPLAVIAVIYLIIIITGISIAGFAVLRDR